MISSLLNAFAETLGRDFLYGSFLPALLFVCGLGAVFVAIVGLEGSTAWMQSLSGSELAVGSAVASIALVGFAFILTAVRRPVQQLWAAEGWGGLLWGLFGLLRWWHARARRKLEAKITQPAPWRAIFDDFRKEVTPIWNSQHPQVPSRERERLELLARSLPFADGPEAVSRALGPLVAAHGMFAGEGLGDAYAATKLALLARDEEEALILGGRRRQLDATYGSEVRATRLGNVICSFGSYPARRYGMESEVFWPHLSHQLDDSARGAIESRKLLLDFALTMATLALSWAALAVFVGPWLMHAFWLWLLLAVGALVLARGFYGMGLRAAEDLGDHVRCAYDLFQLDMLESLGRERPADIEQTRLFWSQQSRLRLYGTSENFKIARMSEK